MNKKLLICGAIATSLFLTACVKKETPKEDEQEQVEVTTESQQPIELQPLTPSEPEAPAQVEVIREETPNTTTEIRREPAASAPATVATEPAPAKTAETPKTEEKPAPAKPTNSNSNTQTEDDAVAAAIAAATPALEN